MLAYAMVSGVNIAGYGLTLLAGAGAVATKPKVDINKKIVDLFGPDGLKRGLEYFDDFSDITSEVTKRDASMCPHPPPSFRIDTNSLGRQTLTNRKKTWTVSWIA